MSADLPRVLYGKACDEIDSKTRDTIAALAHDLESGKRQSALLDAWRNAGLSFITRTGPRPPTPAERQQPSTFQPASCVTIPAPICSPTARRDSVRPGRHLPWTRFLEDIFPAMLRLSSSCAAPSATALTGDVREQILLIATVPAATANPCSSDILRKLLGRLALQAGARLAHDRPQPPTSNGTKPTSTAVASSSAKRLKTAASTRCW